MLSTTVALLTLLLPGVSELWGHAGESWSPDGRLPDFSYAGYHHGEVRLPQVPVVANVRDYGAVGDGVTDDSAAFQAALANMPQGKLFIPRGNYVLSEILYIDRDGIVLQGEGRGPGGTVLSFTRGLQELTGEEHPWDYGEGGLIKIGVGAMGMGHLAIGNIRTNVTHAAARGDLVLRVSDTTNINAGDYILLDMQDPADRSLGWEMHNGQAAPGNCEWQPLPHYWPVQVAETRPQSIVLKQPLRLDVELAWQPRIRAFNPVRESGVQSLRIQFPFHTYPGHHDEVGFNALCFEGALNCWARDVDVVNADNGVVFSDLSKNCLAKRVRLLAGVDGHHGFMFVHDAADCLVDTFFVEPVFLHAFTVDHMANGNVARRGAGTNINLDHHRDSPYENLFTNIHLGLGTNAFGSSGSLCAGPHAGARNTYWNLVSFNWSLIPTPDWIDIQTNVIPGTVTSKTEDERWLELITVLEPSDLYLSQLHRRLGDDMLEQSDGSDEPLSPEAP